MRRVLALAVMARVAIAQPQAELTREFQAGVDAFRLGKLDDARAHLEKARALDPSLPGPHRFLAAVAQAQGKPAECVDEARAAVISNPRSQEIGETRKLHEACRVATGRAPLRVALGDDAAIAVTANVPGATVFVGGIDYGGTPIEPRAIAVGPVDIVVQKEGWKTQKVNVEAVGGIVTDVAVELDPDLDVKPRDGGTNVKPEQAVGWIELATTSGTVRVDDRPVASAGRIELAPGTHTIEIAVERHEPWRRRVRILDGKTIVLHPALVATADRVRRVRTGYAFLAGAGVLAIGGVALALGSEAAANNARDIVRVETTRDPTQPLSATSAIEPVRTRADFDRARTRAIDFAIASDAAYGAALVAGILGAYYLYRGERECDDMPPPFAAIAPVRGGAVIAKELRW